MASQSSLHLSTPSGLASYGGQPTLLAINRGSFSSSVGTASRSSLGA